MLLQKGAGYSFCIKYSFCNFLTSELNAIFIHKVDVLPPHPSPLTSLNFAALKLGCGHYTHPLDQG